MNKALKCQPEADPVLEDPLFLRGSELECHMSTSAKMISD